MGIDREQLQRHVQDFVQTTGRAATRFVCPITLRECDESELINGHILNKSLRTASRKTVIQYREVDGFFGGTVEPGMVHFLNMVDSDDTVLTRQHRPTRLHFADGSHVPAFATNNRAASRAIDCTRLNVQTVDGRLTVLARAAPQDPRWRERYRLEYQIQFTAFHWVAAMLKAAYLCLFDMIGYKAVYDPFGDAVRQTLANYYHERQKSGDAERHFADFKNSVKVLTSPDFDASAARRWRPYSFDSLEDREVLFHNSLSGTFFAQTCIFGINSITASVTLPAGMNNTDAGDAWRLYCRLMNEPTGFPQRFHRARFRGDRWEYETTPTDIRFVSQLPSNAAGLATVV